MTPRTAGSFAAVLGLTLLAAGSAGCANTGASRGNVGPVFYPHPPSPPRVAYLTSINRGDFFGPKRTGLERFLFVRRDDGNRTISKPFGVAAGNETLLVCDTEKNIVHVFDFKTREYTTLGGGGRGRLRKPVDVAIDEAGNRYVADALRNEVVVFDRHNEADRAIGGLMEEDEGFRPIGVEVFGDKLYVLNAAARRVEVLDPVSGDILSTFGQEEGQGRLAWPSGLAVDSAGRTYVTDLQTFTVRVWDADGKFTRSFGEAGDRPGLFSRPKHLAIGPEGIAYVVDAGFQRVQMFDDRGRVLMLFGGPIDQRGGLTLPGGICVDRSLLPHLAQYVPDGFEADYLVFVTDQFSRRGLNVYAFGRMNNAAEP